MRLRYLAAAGALAGATSGLSAQCTPTLLGSAQFPGARAVALQGGLAFVAADDTGLQILDVTNPAAPVLLAAFETPGHGYDVAVSGDILALADGSGGLEVLDISDPSSPVQVGGREEWAYSVQAVGSRAYVAGGFGGGLRIFDLSDPANPALLGEWSEILSAEFGVCVAGSRAYLSDANAGLKILDVSDPTNPEWLGGFDPGSRVWAVAVEGNVALLANDESGLRVLDVSDPAGPVELSLLPTSGPAVGVTLAGGGLALVAVQEGGLDLVDVSDPANPSLLGVFDTSGYAWDAAASADLAFVADEGDGLVVVDFSDCVGLCRVDITGDGLVDTRDVLAFLNAWVAGDQVADWDSNGTIDTRDVIAFLNAWVAGC